MKIMGKPKPTRTNFEENNFVLLRDGRKYCAQCKLCQRILSNTASARLLTHRRRCNNTGVITCNNLPQKENVRKKSEESSMEDIAMDPLVDDTQTTMNSIESNDNSISKKKAITVIKSEAVPQIEVNQSTSRYQMQDKHNEEEILAMAWALELKNASPQQKLFAKKAINDILFEAQLGTLHRNSVKINLQAY